MSSFLALFTFLLIGMGFASGMGYTDLNPETMAVMFTWPYTVGEALAQFGMSAETLTPIAR